MSLNKLNAQEISSLVDKAIDSFPQDACSSCECYVGYITRLELDAGQEMAETLKKYKPSQDQVHSCLGCDPCPPADMFSAYLRKKSPQ